MLVHIFQLQNPHNGCFSSEVNKGISLYLTYYQCVSKFPLSTNMQGHKRVKADVTGGGGLPWPRAEVDCSAQGAHTHIHIYLDTHIYVYINIYMSVYIYIYKYVPHC